MAGAAATGIIGLLALGALSGIERDAATKFKDMERAKLAEEGISRDLWLKTSMELKAANFTELTLPDNTQLFIGPQSEYSGALKIETVIKRGNVTVAVADVIKPRHVATWVYGSDRDLLDGNVPKNAPSALGISDLSESIAAAREGTSDVIAVGTESSYTELATPPLRPAITKTPLSLRRSRELASAVAYNPWFTNDGARIYYWALDLGKATTPAAKDTAEELAQRAAILVTLSRRMNVTERLSLREAITLVVTNLEVGGVKLAGFTNSATAASHLYTEQQWSGGTSRADDPKIDLSSR